MGKHHVAPFFGQWFSRKGSPFDTKMIARWQAPQARSPFPDFRP
jgi:hypothetical protein